CRSLEWARMEVQSNLDARIYLRANRSKKSRNLLRRSKSDCVCERNLPDSLCSKFSARIENRVDTPRITVRIAKGHRYIDNKPQPRLIRRSLDRLKCCKRAIRR